ncbi:hypothetical protein WR25_22296 [Diploscapter pachys]|uniref:ABC transporter domain-containing protein n=1 Tax=Diploscapter pachys TaxID=2018661 RepID=A0A2A2JTQ3_9BILA|nr:hypothetical protein WR25_22296 [Diploscapter pachys]
MEYPSSFSYSESIVDECRRGWPIGPTCSRLVGFGLYTLLGIVNLIVLFLPKGANPYNRLSTTRLPFSFFVTTLTLALLVADSIFHSVFLIFIKSQFTQVLLAFCIAKTAFWLICLCSQIRWRDLPFLPYTLALSFSLSLIFQLIPFTAWKLYFKRNHSDAEFIFFVVELSLTSLLLLSSMFAPLLGSSGNSNSAFSNFSHKISLIAPYVWPKKSVGLQIRVAICLLLLVLGRLINVALPLYSKWIVDSLANPAHFQYSLIFVSSGLKFLQGNGAMGGFLNTIRSYLWIPIQQYTTRELEIELFAHLHSLSLRWHLSRKTGLVLRVMDRGTTSVNSILNYVLFNIVPTITDIVIAVVFFFSTFNIYFGILVFITMVLYLVVTIYVTEWRTAFQREMNEKDNASSAIGTDSLLNYETVKYYSNEDYEVNRFRRAIESYQLAEWRSNASLALLNSLQNGIIGVGLTAGSLLVCYLITSEGKLTNMFDLMNEEIEVQDASDAIEYQPKDDVISVKNLTFSYNKEVTVLKDISFEVGRGQTVALVGPSGSGKSTIIRLLFRLFESSEDSIAYDGIDIRSLKLKSLRKQIGIVPQDTVLFNDTIMYNIRFGNPSASDEEVYDAAKAAMIHDKIISLPNGYDTLVGERGLKLSGGEKQRVAIARTILKKPQFIFLDEATSALDTKTERAIQKCLEELCSTRTGVVVAHRLSTVVSCNQILVLDKGIIIERGSHSTLLAKKGIYYHMWQSQNTNGDDEKAHSEGEHSNSSN